MPSTIDGPSQQNRCAVVKGNAQRAQDDRKPHNDGGIRYHRIHLLGEISLKIHQQRRRGEEKIQILQRWHLHD